MTPRQTSAVAYAMFGPDRAVPELVRLLERVCRRRFDEDEVALWLSRPAGPVEVPPWTTQQVHRALELGLAELRERTGDGEALMIQYTGRTTESAVADPVVRRHAFVDGLVDHARRHDECGWTASRAAGP